METESSLELRSLELQDWQRQILEMDYQYMFELKPQQKKMIEELMFPSDSNPYWIEKEYRKVLERVLNLGYYKEEDREALNYARECYLKGKTWIN